MANDLRGLVGLFATGTTGVAAAATFGRVTAINNAVESCCEYTEGALKESITGAAVQGQGKKALQRTGEFVNGVANGTPVVGHLKGVVHKVVGDEKGATAAYSAANRGAAVTAGGVAGFCASGPVGAGMGALAAGTAYDGEDSKFLQSLDKLFEGQADVSDVLDGCFLVPTGDFMVGYAVGKALESQFEATNAKLKSKGMKAVKGRTVNGGENLYEMRQGRGGGAKLYAHNKSTTFRMNKKAIQAIKREVGMEKKIHVATGAHGDKGLGARHGPFADSINPASSTFNYLEDRTQFVQDYIDWGNKDIIIYDVGDAAQWASFKAMMTDPSAVLYIDWCHGVDNKWAM